MQGPRSTRTRINALRHGNEMKGSHMVIATDAGKASGKIQRLHDKNTQQNRIEGTNPNIIKAKNEKPTAHVTLSGETEAFPRDQGEGEVRTHRPPPRDTGLEVPAGVARPEKEMKGARVRKKDNHSLLADDVISYVENHTCHRKRCQS